MHLIMSLPDRWKAAVSVAGRFWAFELAQQLHQRGELAQLLTTYPKFEVVKYGIPKELTSSCLWQELAKRAIPNCRRSAIKVETHSISSIPVSIASRPGDYGRGRPVCRVVGIFVAALCAEPSPWAW